MYHDKNTDPRPKRTHIKSKFEGYYIPCGSFAAHYGPPLILPEATSTKQTGEAWLLLIMIVFVLIALLPRPAPRRFFIFLQIPFV